MEFRADPAEVRRDGEGDRAGEYDGRGKDHMGSGEGRGKGIEGWDRILL